MKLPFQRNIVEKCLLMTLVVLLLACCESQKHIAVLVLDQENKQAIPGVFVQVRAGKNGDYTKNYAEGYTDSLGKFSCELMIGCAGGCYDIYMDYSKLGYQKKSEFNQTEDTVYLQAN